MGSLFGMFRPSLSTYSNAKRSVSLPQELANVSSGETSYTRRTMRPKPISVRETSYGQLSALARFPSVYGRQRGSLARYCAVHRPPNVREIAHVCSQLPVLRVGSGKIGSEVCAVEQFGCRTIDWIASYTCIE